MPNLLLKTPAPEAPPQHTATEAFELWCAQQLAQGELQERSVAKYRPLWNAYVRWLREQDLAWSEIGVEDLQRLFAGPPLGSGKRRHAHHHARMSNYTQQRYWRLLRGVYHHAVHHGTLTHHPLLDLPDPLRPAIARADRLAQVLPPTLFAHLRQAQHLIDLIPLQSERDWWHVRDRALMAVLIDTGLTTSELIALRGMDVRAQNNRPLTPQLGPHTQDLELTQQGQPTAALCIDVMRTRATIERTLELSAPMAGVLLQWMGRRQTLLEQRLHPTAWPHAPLFVARRAATPAQTSTKTSAKSSVIAASPHLTAAMPPMDAVTVYYAVRQTLNAFVRELQQDMRLERLHTSVRLHEPPTPPSAQGPEQERASLTGEDAPLGQAMRVAQGPAIIRNSVLRHWLDTVGVDETLRRAGLKNLRSLRLIP